MRQPRSIENSKQTLTKGKLCSNCREPTTLGEAACKKCGTMLW